MLMANEPGDANKPAGAVGHELLFQWQTMREVRSQALPFKKPVPGAVFAVELISGPKVEVFRADDGEFFFCHGLTFGGKEAPGGPVSPFSGKDVRTILENHYRLVDPESQARAGDILVWRGPGDETPHSATLTEVVLVPGRHYLDYATKLRTKNGKQPEAEMTLERLVAGPESYGESYNVFRRT